MDEAERLQRDRDGRNAMGKAVTEQIQRRNKIIDEFDQPPGNVELVVNARVEFFKRYFDLKKDIPVIKKDGTASFLTKTGKKFEYSFASLQHIQHILKPILKEHEFVIFHDSVVCDNKAWLRTHLRHNGGIEKHTDWPMPVKDQNDPQAYGSSRTYGRRYNIIDLLDLCIEEEEDDGNYKPRVKPKGSRGVLTTAQYGLLQKKMEAAKKSASDVMEFGTKYFNKKDPRTWTGIQFNQWLESLDGK